MTVTARNITDDQIRDVRSSVAGLTVAPHIEALCDLALGSTEEARIVLALRPRDRKIARARIADFINARAKEAP